ncbi:MAG TPA: lysophospholipid acyltransferase family protein [Acidimicrobiia bacterium]|nr:lysophospholipid acyltransferase family protein [Acidimicrobiia bacterium]
MKAFYQFARFVIVGGCYVLFRLEVHGRELVPSRGPYVLAPTHRSIIDTFVSASVTRERVRFMGKKELWANSFSSWLLTALGGFPVDRGAGTGAVKAALDVLDGGEPVVVFPEGTRRTGARIDDVHQGAAYLAVKRGVPLVPIGIAGTEEILSRGHAIPRLKRIAVVVGPPMHPRTSGGVANRDEVKRLTAELTTELQRLFDEASALVA